MTGVDREPEAIAVRRRLADPVQFKGLLVPIRCVGVGTGMQFHHRRPAGGARFQLRRIRVDEERGADPRIVQPPARPGHGIHLAGDVQTAFRGEFFAFFRNQANVFRKHPQRDIQHRIGDGHFQVDPGLHGTLHDLEIAVLNMAAIFPQVNGDAVGAGALGGQRCGHGIRIRSPPRLAQRSDVIDVDTQCHVSKHQFNSRAKTSSRIVRVRNGRSPR